MKTEEQKRLRSAVAMLVVAVVGMLTAVVSGLALVPRVRLVEVVMVIAGGVGGGAALAAAVAQFREARAAGRHPSGHAGARTPPASR